MKTTLLTFGLVIQIITVTAQTSIKLDNQEIVNGFIRIDALINGIGYNPDQVVKNKIGKIVVKQYSYKFGEIDNGSATIAGEYGFDKNGNLLNIDSKRQLTYNQLGFKTSDYSSSESHSYELDNARIVKHIHSWNSGKNSRVYKYTYNSKGQITKKIAYDENGNSVSYESDNYVYNSQGLLITVKSDYTLGDNGGLEQKFTYDSRKNLIKVERFFPRGNEEYTFKYNSQNQIIEETHKESFSNFKILNKYDTNGRKVQSIFYNSSGEPYRTYKYFYE